MNNKEIRTIEQEAHRFSKDILVITAGQVGVKLELPFMSAEQTPLYFFVEKRKGAKKFSLMMPVESTGLIAVSSTLVLLQPLFRTYGLLITQDAIIIEEEDHLSLHLRIKNMTQAIISIDGIRRLWIAEHDRRTKNNVKSEAVKPASYGSDDRPSR